VAENNRVFVVHGRNAAARNALFAFLRSIGLRPLEWAQAIEATSHPSPMITDILDAAFDAAQAVVVLLTGDDEVRLRRQFTSEADPQSERELLPQARANVLFEAGLALGRAPNRTVFVEVGTVKPFSDNAGRHTVRFDGSTQRRQELASKLRLAGCSVDLTGTDWHSAGDFVSAVAAGDAHVSRIDADPPRPSIARTILLGSDSGNLATSLEISNTNGISAGNFTCRIVQRNAPYWRFGWQLNVKNQSRAATRYRLEFRYLDEHGHALYDSTDHSDVSVASNETKQLSGVALVDADLSPAVRRVLLILSSRTA
jgi:hypothetical protein